MAEPWKVSLQLQGADTLHRLNWANLAYWSTTLPADASVLGLVHVGQVDVQLEQLRTWMRPETALSLGTRLYAPTAIHPAAFRYGVLVSRHSEESRAHHFSPLYSLSDGKDLASERALYTDYQFWDYKGLDGTVFNYHVRLCKSFVEFEGLLLAARMAANRNWTRMHPWKSLIAPTVPAVAGKVDFSGLAHGPTSTKKAPKLRKPPWELSNVGSGDSSTCSSGSELGSGRSFQK